MTISTTIQLKTAITVLEGHSSGGGSGSGGCGGGGGGDGDGCSDSGCDIIYCSGYIYYFIVLKVKIKPIILDILYSKKVK